jgi:aspartate racemase
MPETGPIAEASRPRVIGLVGGMSWEATALYYRYLNEAVAERLGGHHNARSVLVTIDFEEVLGPVTGGDWDRAAEIVTAAAQAAERGGAECILLTANTAHLIADRVAAACRTPLLHIVDAVGEAARKAGLRRLGLAATEFTMASGLYERIMAERFGIEVILPGGDDRAFLQRTIIDELTRGLVLEPSRARCLDIVGRLAGDGAEAVILGCTELPLLLDGAAGPVPFLDSTKLHVAHAVDFAFASADTQSTTTGVSRA